jgi:hypothetical protein
MFTATLVFTNAMWAMCRSHGRHQDLLNPALPALRVDLRPPLPTIEQTSWLNAIE